MFPERVKWFFKGWILSSYYSKNNDETMKTENLKYRRWANDVFPVIERIDDRWDLIATPNGPAMTDGDTLSIIDTVFIENQDVMILKRKAQAAWRNYAWPLVKENFYPMNAEAIRSADDNTPTPQHHNKMPDTPQPKETTESGSDAPTCSASSKYRTSRRIKFACDDWGGRDETHLEIEWNGQTLMLDITEARIHIIGPCFDVQKDAVNAMDLTPHVFRHNDQVVARRNGAPPSE
jgi:hypothetical protein